MANIIGGKIGASSVVVNDYNISIENIDGGHRLKIKRGSEIQNLDVMDGATGPQGAKGDTGEIGPQGPKGETGAPGAIQTVNGVGPDENGNVQVSGLPEGGTPGDVLVRTDSGAEWQQMDKLEAADVDELMSILK